MDAVCVPSKAELLTEFCWSADCVQGRYIRGVKMNLVWIKNPEVMQKLLHLPPSMHKKNYQIFCVCLFLGLKFEIDPAPTAN